MIDPKKAFDVGKDGIVINDDQGNFNFILLAGPNSPVGFLDASQPALYIDGLSQVYRKTGPTVNDWELLGTGTITGGTLTIGGNPVDAVFTAEECVGGTDINGN